MKYSLKKHLTIEIIVMDIWLQSIFLELGTAALLPRNCAKVTELSTAATGHVKAAMIQLDNGTAFWTCLPSLATCKRPDLLRDDTLRTSISRMGNLFTQNTNPSIALVAGDFVPVSIRRTQECGTISRWAIDALRDGYCIFQGFMDEEHLSLNRKKGNNRTGRNSLVATLGREHGLIMRACSNEVGETFPAVMMVARGQKGRVFGELFVADYASDSFYNRNWGFRFVWQVYI